MICLIEVLNVEGIVDHYRSEAAKIDLAAIHRLYKLIKGVVVLYPDIKEVENGGHDLQKFVMKAGIRDLRNILDQGHR